MSKISRIDILPLSIPLRKPFVISLETFTHAENIAVRIETGDGRVGWGECSPFPSINGETQPSGLVVAERLRRVLETDGSADIHRANELMNRSIYGNTSVKSAFDTALHDLAAQRRNLPLYRFWGAPQWSILKTDYTVSLGSTEEMTAAAVNIRAAGYEQIKLKLGGKPETDIERVRAIRAAIGPDVPLRLDANQGWDYDGALLVLTALGDANILFCEAPIPRHAVARLPELRRAVPVPIMADECCFDHHDAERLLAAEACDYLNIKIGKAGGLLEARKILKVAERYGTKVQLGGFLESRLGFTAAAHLALSSPAVAWVDFDSPLFMAEDPVAGGLSYGDGGVIKLPDDIGLGAGLSDASTAPDF